MLVGMPNGMRMGVRGCAHSIATRDEHTQKKMTTHSQSHVTARGSTQSFIFLTSHLTSLDSQHSITFGGLPAALSHAVESELASDAPALIRRPGALPAPAPLRLALGYLLPLIPRRAQLLIDVYSCSQYPRSFSSTLAARSARAQPCAQGCRRGTFRPTRRRKRRTDGTSRRNVVCRMCLRPA